MTIETLPSYPGEIPPEYSYYYDPERGEFLIINPNGVPLGYVDSPEQFVPNIPKTGDKALIVLLTIMMIGGMTTVVVLVKKRKTKK